jgi:hypothetical protein
VASRSQKRERESRKRRHQYRKTAQSKHRHPPCSLTGRSYALAGPPSGLELVASPQREALDEFSDAELVLVEQELEDPRSRLGSPSPRELSAA